MTSRHCLNSIARAIGAILLLSTGLAHADKETGYFRVGSLGGSWPISNYLILENKIKVTAGTGRCQAAAYAAFVGNGTVGAPLTGTNSEGNKAMYSLLLAASLAGKQVTIDYSYITDGSAAYNCLLNHVSID